MLFYTSTSRKAFIAYNLKEAKIEAKVCEKWNKSKTSSKSDYLLKVIDPNLEELLMKSEDSISTFELKQTIGKHMV